MFWFLGLALLFIGTKKQKRGAAADAIDQHAARGTLRFQHNGTSEVSISKTERRHVRGSELGISVTLMRTFDKDVAAAWHTSQRYETGARRGRRKQIKNQN